MSKYLIFLCLIVIILLTACESRRTAGKINLLLSGEGEYVEKTLSERQGESSALTSQIEALGPPQGVSPETFEALKAELIKQVKRAGINKFASRPPEGARNAVDDLSVSDNGDGTLTLTWSYRNLGDYNQDGAVNIADITPLAEHFLESTSAQNEWIDGNADGTISIGDVTPLAEYFFSQCSS